MVGAVGIHPGNGKAAVIERRYGRCILGPGGLGIDPEIAPHLLAVAIKTLADNIVAGPAGLGWQTAGIAPGNNKAAIRKSAYRGFVLLVAQIGIDEELIAHGATGRAKNLAIDIPRPVSPGYPLLDSLVLGLPDHDRLAVAQAGHRRLILGMAGPGIDPCLFSCYGLQGCTRRGSSSSGGGG